MHIPPFENENRPIIDADDTRVPLNYFNIIKLSHGQSFAYFRAGLRNGHCSGNRNTDNQCRG